MKTKIFILAAAAMLGAWSMSAQAQVEAPYIDVTGVADVEVAPDEIHYVIEIKEYYEEEFDGKSKPEEYKTKVPIATIETNLRQALDKAGVDDDCVRVQQVGDYWRYRGQDFLVSKRYDITLKDFAKIDKIISNLDTRGVNMMYIGEMKNKDLPALVDKGKAEALKDARRKAEYMAEALGVKLGRVLRVVEPSYNPGYARTVINAEAKMMSMAVSDAAGGSYDEVKNIKQTYTMQVRFEIVNKKDIARGPVRGDVRPPRLADDKAPRGEMK